MSDTPSRPRRGGSFRTLVWLVLLAGAVGVTGTFAFRAGDQYGYRRGHTVGFREGYSENKEAHTLARRQGQNLSIAVSLPEVLDGLADLDPPVTTDAFRTALDHLYGALIAQSARAYPFPGGHEQRALDAWAQMRARVVDGHYQTLRKWQGRRAPLPGMRLSLDHHARATDLHTVMNDEACTVVRDVWTVSAAPDQGRPGLPGLCALIDKELLAPWMADLEKEALARDVQASVTATQTTHRDTIMELATAELRIDGSVRQDYESKLFEGWVIESTDRATLEVRGTGIVKSGFKMHEAYEVVVMPEDQVIRVTLPRAEILSNTLVPVFSQDKEGWWTSLDSRQRNLAIRTLQEQIERQALQDGILQEAEDRAEELVRDLYSPFTALPGSPYTVQVVFAGDRKPQE